jgi:hypothetical protein
MRAETPILTASAAALCNTLSDVCFSPQVDWEVRIGVIWPNLGVFQAEFFYYAGQIQADSRSVGHVSHGSRLVDSLDGGPESLDLDASLVNGLIIDVRHAPREIQETAFRQELIPYIPET